MTARISVTKDANGSISIKNVGKEPIDLQSLDPAFTEELIERAMVTLKLSLVQKLYAVADTARKFIPDPGTIQWENREIELAQRMRELDLEINSIG